MNTPTDGRPIAAFDFDGTISTHDSFVAFLQHRLGVVRYGLGLLRLLPSLWLYATDRDRGRVKSDMFLIYLQGLDHQALEAAAEAFAEQAFKRLIRPDALARLKWHRAQGHEVVIVTASPRIMIAPFARRLGVDHLIGTELCFDPDKNALQIAGENCRAEEKVNRLKAHYGADLNLIAAYGDTSGDVQMIAAAKIKGMRLFKKKPHITKD